MRRNRANFRLKSIMAYAFTWFILPHNVLAPICFRKAVPYNKQAFFITFNLGIHFFQLLKPSSSHVNRNGQNSDVIWYFLCFFLYLVKLCIKGGCFKILNKFLSPYQWVDINLQEMNSSGRGQWCFKVG